VVRQTRERSHVPSIRRGWKTACATAGLAAVVAGVAGPVPVGAAPATEIQVPSFDAAPVGIAAGPSGSVWFVENTGYAVGRIDSGGHVTEFPVPANTQGLGGSLNSIVEGSDGAMWFTDENLDVPRIGRIDASSGSITMFELPTSGVGGFPGAQPLQITSGPDGALWFTTFRGGVIGRIDTAGHTSAFTVPQGAETRGITVGPDGAIWFTDNNPDAVGRLDPGTHQITLHHLFSPLSNVTPVGIATGPDGALWFTESGLDRIGRLDPTTGTVTKISTPTKGSQPYGLVKGSDGALWFTEAAAGNVGRIDPVTHKIKESPLSGNLTAPMQIASGADGGLWIAEAGADRIGRLDPNHRPSGAANKPASAGIVAAAYEIQCPVQQPCSTQITSGGTFKVKTFTQSLPPGAIRLTGYLVFPPNPDGTFTLQAPVNGAPQLVSQPVPVPGGLLGTFPTLGPILAPIVGPIVGPLNDLSISLSLAGPVHLRLSPFVATVPVILHLNNLALGTNCTIGPVVQNLAITYTSAKANDPSMAWQPSRVDAADNTFSVPGSQGCGPLPPPFTLVVDAAINQQLGLPSASGNNSADLPGVVSAGPGVHP
jgi:streptogramin lyase